MGKLWEKNVKFFFASLNSMEKGVGSGVGSRFISQMYGFGSGSAPKCHGFPTLIPPFGSNLALRWTIKYRFAFLLYFALAHPTNYPLQMYSWQVHLETVFCTGPAYLGCKERTSNCFAFGCLLSELHVYLTSGENAKSTNAYSTKSVQNAFTKWKQKKNLTCSPKAVI